MQHLFTPEGEAALVVVMASRPLLAFDFDGTLAPIVARPEDARVANALEQRLKRLAQRLPLAIVSGRRVDDILGRLSFAPRYVIGNHGAEDPSAVGFSASALDGMRARLLAHGPAIEALGVSIEDKIYSIALHYRLATDHAAAFRLITSLVDELPAGLHAYGGKMVMNIVLTAAPNKADAVASLVARSGAHSAVFAGDDLNDEPVFAAAAPEWLTIRIGAGETPSQARFYLESPDEVAVLFDRMLILLGDPASALGAVSIP